VGFGVIFSDYIWWGFVCVEKSGVYLRFLAVEDGWRVTFTLLRGAASGVLRPSVMIFSGNSFISATFSGMAAASLSMCGVGIFPSGL
jgi:hypothetical protein